MIRKNSTICANYQLIMRMIGGFLKILDENMLDENMLRVKTYLFLDAYP